MIEDSPGNESILFLRQIGILRNANQGASGIENDLAYEDYVACQVLEIHVQPPDRYNIQVN
jgi:hypothetical protein